METVTTRDCGRLVEPEYLLGSREFVAHGWLETTGRKPGKQTLIFHFVLYISHFFFIHLTSCLIHHFFFSRNLTVKSLIHYRCCQLPASTTWESIYFQKYFPMLEESLIALVYVKFMENNSQDLTTFSRLHSYGDNIWGYQAFITFLLWENLTS